MAIYLHCDYSQCKYIAIIKKLHIGTTLTFLSHNISSKLKHDVYYGFVQKSDWFSRLFQNKITSFSRRFKAFCSSLCVQKHYRIGF